MIVEVARSPAPTVSFTSPDQGDRIVQGDTVMITIKTGDDSQITAVAFSVNGQSAPFSRPDKFTCSYKLSGPPTVAAGRVSSLSPHVFVGQATLNCAPAPDGTVVIAYVAGSRASTLDILATVINGAGQSGLATMSIPVYGLPVQAGTAIVVDGGFSLTVTQPSGQSSGGKEVTFKVDAVQTGIWDEGGGTSLILRPGPEPELKISVEQMAARFSSLFPVHGKLAIKNRGFPTRLGCPYVFED